MITRADAIQRFLDLYPSPSYLEIGVFQGETFRAIRAARKVAVDPAFAFDPAAEPAAAVPTDYHKITSDRYFGETIGACERFDVVYLDGLHTFEQTLRDLLNALAVLKPTGTVILDDTVPGSYQASLADQDVCLRIVRAIGSDDHSWMGDVYRLVYFVQTFLQQYSYATIMENHGQTVLWREPRPAAALAPRGVEAIARLDYADVVTTRDAFAFMPLADIVARVQRQVHAHGAG